MEIYEVYGFIYGLLQFYSPVGGVSFIDCMVW